MSGNPGTGAGPSDRKARPGSATDSQAPPWRGLAVVVGLSLLVVAYALIGTLSAMVSPSAWAGRGWRRRLTRTALRGGALLPWVYVLIVASVAARRMPLTWSASWTYPGRSCSFLRSESLPGLRNSALFERRRSGLAYEEDRTFGVEQHLLGLTADQCPLQARHAGRAEDDEVGSYLVRNPDDALVGDAID